MYPCHCVCLSSYEIRVISHFPWPMYTNSVSDTPSTQLPHVGELVGCAINPTHSSEVLIIVLAVLRHRWQPPIVLLFFLFHQIQEISTWTKTIWRVFLQTPSRRILNWSPLIVFLVTRWKNTTTTHFAWRTHVPRFVDWKTIIPRFCTDNYTEWRFFFFNFNGVCKYVWRQSSGLLPTMILTWWWPVSA